MDRFNRLFQKSTENTTCELYQEMNRFVKLYAANLLKKEALLEASDNLRLLNFDSSNQLSNENLGIGNSTWLVLAEVETEHDTKPFYVAVRKFYLATIKKMLKKFPFGDSILKDLGILQPEKTTSYDVSTVVSLAKRFPQLDLNTSESLDLLKEEFTDFLLSQDDIEQPSTYQAWEPNFSEYRHADKIEKARAGSFCWKVGQMKSLDGEPRFPTLFKLMAGLLSIPCSNADAERGFSVLRKIHTDQRQPRSLNHC